MASPLTRHTDALPALSDPEEARLLSEMARGLPLRLACAAAGVDWRTVQECEKSDAAFAGRVRAARDAVIARLVTQLYERAEKGDAKAARFFLETSGDPAFVPSLRIGRISEEELARHPAVIALLDRVSESLSEQPPEGCGAEYARGWSAALAGARERMQSESGS